MHKYFHAGQITVKLLLNKEVNTINIKARNIQMGSLGEFFNIRSILSLQKFTKRGAESSVT